MFYNFEQIDDFLYEQALEEFWDCPEALYADDED